MAQNGKNFCLPHSISQETYHMIIFGAHVQKDGISNNFFLFYENSDFSGFFFFFFGGGKRAKNDPKLPISVHQTLYLMNCRSYHQDI